MNHHNGDVLAITFDKKHHQVEKIKLYRQDGFGHYYYDPKAQVKIPSSLTTKKDAVNATKKVSRHISDVDRWHHKVTPVYNAQHQIVDFEPKLALRHHTKITNAKRYLTHLNHHHADYLFRKNNDNLLISPVNYVKDFIYADRNKEMVLAHNLHKLSRD